MKQNKDPKYFKSEKTGRGLLKEGWRETQEPIMCSYKLVSVKFEVWGLQTRVEQFVHKVVRDILLIGHRQAFAWVDEWYDMTMEDVREYEKSMHEKTNIKVCNQHSSPVDEIESHAKGSVYMTMDEVREYERATQEATNKKIGIFPPAISISNISLPFSIRSAPSSAPSTPLSTDAPEFLAVPKDRPRKKSAPETLTLPDPDKKAL
ncbi:Cytoplasmic phosphatidylinositol transfer protein 1 [Varanus komodoensis]|nr:Cytoplasmic phosphatidylinositol transfer protein 1 [Varanus komodoensis]